MSGSINSYEAKLRQGGLSKPLSTYLSTEGVERIAALGQGIKNYANTAAIANTFVGVARVGNQLYVGDGNLLTPTQQSSYNITANTWVNIPTFFKLVSTGSGNLIITTQNRSNTITSNAIFYSISSEVLVERLFISEDSYKISCDFPNTLSIILGV